METFNQTSTPEEAEDAYFDILEERFFWDYETGDYSIFQPLKKEI